MNEYLLAHRRKQSTGQLGIREDIKDGGGGILNYLILERM